MESGITINDDKVICNHCARWEWQSSGKAIKHSSRCDTPNAQYAESIPPTISSDFDGRNKPGAFSKDSPASGLTNSEIKEAVYRREISISDAMNTDF